MHGGRESQPSQVRSADGTQIAYWTSGTGPPLVLVHGAPADHTRWQPLLPFLEPHVTVHAMDRRGRGGSGDSADYQLEREAEDVVAVVRAAADTSGGDVDLYGHSYGGLCAFGAAALTTAVRRLVLYEGWPVPDPTAAALPPGLMDRLEALQAVGDSEGVVETLFRDLMKMPEPDFAIFRALPSWQARVAAAHTLPRELRALETALLDSEQARRITAPTLLLTGSDSPDPCAASVEQVAQSLGSAQVLVLDDQQHVADLLIPEVFATHLLSFLHVDR